MATAQTPLNLPAAVQAQLAAITAQPAVRREPELQLEITTAVCAAFDAGQVPGRMPELEALVSAWLDQADRREARASELGDCTAGKVAAHEASMLRYCAQMLTEAALLAGILIEAGTDHTVLTAMYGTCQFCGSPRAPRMHRHPGGDSLSLVCTECGREPGRPPAETAR